MVFGHVLSKKSLAELIMDLPVSYHWHLKNFSFTKRIDKIPQAIECTTTETETP